MGALPEHSKKRGGYATSPAAHHASPGGATRREAIHAGRWDRIKPRSVRIALTSFMVKDFEGNSHWYDLTKSQYLQGLLAQIDNEQRVYIVTIEPEMEDSRHAVWPRIVSEPKLVMSRN